MENKSSTLLLSILLIIVCILFGIYKYMNRNNPEIEENIFNNYTKEYYELNTVEVEKITKEEFESRLKTYNVTCGVIDVVDSTGELLTCGIDNWDDYVAYVDKGIPYYVFKSSVCEEDSCVEDDEHYDVYKFSNIKNVKQIVSKVDQYNNIEFAYEVNNGDVYYFTPLFDEIEIDGGKHLTHLLKVELPAKLKKFSNIENGQITFGTDIVLELDNDEKYVLQYSYENNKITLIKYDAYVKKYLSETEVIELTGSPETIKLNSSVLKSSKLNSIIYSSEIISNNNVNDGKLIISVDTEEEVKSFLIHGIDNVIGLESVDNDNSDGKYIESYVLDSSNYLYYVGFASVTYDNDYSLRIYKYNVSNVTEFAVVTVYDSKTMLVDGEEPETPQNYVIFKTKDGKYYTDYSLDKSSRTLRQVVSTTEVSSITVNLKVEEKEYSGKTELSKVKTELNKKVTSLNIGNSNEDNSYGVLKIESGKVVLDVIYPDLRDNKVQKNTKYIVSSISNSKSVYINQDLGGEDGYPVEFYVMDSSNNIYVVNFLIRDYQNGSKSIYKVSSSVSANPDYVEINGFTTTGIYKRLSFILDNTFSQKMQNSILFIDDALELNGNILDNEKYKLEFAFQFGNVYGYKTLIGEEVTKETGAYWLTKSDYDEVYKRVYGVDPTYDSNTYISDGYYKSAVFTGYMLDDEYRFLEISNKKDSDGVYTSTAKIYDNLYNCYEDNNDDETYCSTHGKQIGRIEIKYKMNNSDYVIKSISLFEN